MKNIGIIGCGKLGLCFSLLLEKAGYRVYASDISETYINNLNDKIINSIEPDVKKLLSRSKNIYFSTDPYEVLKKCDYIFTYVPTPSNKKGSYDLKYVNQVISTVRKFQNNIYNKKNKNLIIGCTTNPGDCEKIQKKLIQSNIDIFYSPEFIAQGSIINDLKNADMVLLGTSKFNNQKKINFIREIYNKIQIVKPTFYDMSLTSSEVVKLAVNCFLTTKISYANLVGQLLTKLNKKDEIDLVLKAIGDDSRIGNKYLKFGFGFGGPCLPRDNRALGNLSKNLGIINNLGSVVDSFNNDHLYFLKKQCLINNKKNYPFYFSYLAYKKGTDMLVESHQLKLFFELCKSSNKKIYVQENDLVIEQVKNIFSARYLKNVKFIKKKSELPRNFYEIKY